LFKENEGEGLGEKESLAREGKISYVVSAGDFFVRIEKPKAAFYRSSLNIFLFGYSYKKEFKEMPKIRILGRYNNFRVFDGKKELSSSGIKMDLTPSEIIVRVPLETLGDPDFILAYLRISLGKKASKDFFYATGFRKINLN